MFRYIGTTLLTGLITILPIVLTAYLLYWLAVSAEDVLGDFIRLLLPDRYYRPGMGVFAGLLVIFLVGLLMHAYVVQRVFDRAEQFFYRVPFIRSVYRAIRDLLDFFSPGRKKDFEQVVSVTLENGAQLIGFVTAAHPEQMPEAFRDADSVLVYVPMSYMIGGFTVLLPRSAVRPLAMNMDAAMRFALTAGITGNNKTSGERTSR